MTTETPKKTKPKKYRKRKTRLSYGPRGLETLRLAYQVGGFTAVQHSRFFDTPIRNSYKLLASLSDHRLLESAPIQTPGRPRDFCFLSKSNSGRAIAIAGHEAGLGERRAKEQYKLHQLPQHVEHAHTRNEFYLELLETSREEGSVANFHLWNLWGEAFGEFPLRGSRRSEKTYPDGHYEVGFDSELSCRYYLEYESRSRPGEVLRKLDGYGAHFSQCLKEDAKNVRDWLRPVLFLFPRDSTMKHLSFTAAGAIRASAPELQRYLSWQRTAAKRGIHAGRLILFGSLEDVARRGAFAAKTSVLQPYPDGKPGTDLRGVAKEFSEAVARVKGDGSR